MLNSLLVNKLFGKVLSIVRRQCVIASGLILLATSAAAGSIGDARVVASQAEAHAFFFYVDGAPVGVAACGSQTVGSRRFVVDATTASGKAAMAVVLFAHATNKQVDVAGSSQCNVWGDTETAAWVRAK